MLRGAVSPHNPAACKLGSGRHTEHGHWRSQDRWRYGGTPINVLPSLQRLWDLYRAFRKPTPRSCRTNDLCLSCFRNGNSRSSQWMYNNNLTNNRPRMNTNNATLVPKHKSDVAGAQLSQNKYFFMAMLRATKVQFYLGE